jgi:type IV secretory pathway component VirB8
MERSAITSYKEVLRVWNHVKVTDRSNLTWLLCICLFVVYLMTLSVFWLLCDMLVPLTQTFNV